MRQRVGRESVGKAAKPLGIFVLRLAVVLAALVVIDNVYEEYLFAASRVRMGEAMRLWVVMVGAGAMAGLLLEFIPLPRRIHVAWLPLIATVLVVGFLLYTTSLHAFLFGRSFPPGLREVLSVFRQGQMASGILALLLGVLVGKSLKA